MPKYIVLALTSLGMLFCLLPDVNYAQQTCTVASGKSLYCTQKPKKKDLEDPAFVAAYCECKGSGDKPPCPEEHELKSCSTFKVDGSDVNACECKIKNCGNNKELICDENSSCECVKITFTVSKIENLGFGTMTTTGVSSGSITVNPSTNTRSYNGSVIPIGSDYGRAVFKVTGKANKNFSISLPSTIVIKNQNNHQATISNMTYHPTPGNLRTDASGKADVYVGGQLQISGSDAGGDYSGDFTITAD
jgi:hypothetical protein